MTTTRTESVYVESIYLIYFTGLEAVELKNHNKRRKRIIPREKKKWADSLFLAWTKNEKEKKRLNQNGQKRASGEKTWRLRTRASVHQLESSEAPQTRGETLGRCLSGSIILSPVFLSRLSCVGGEDVGKDASLPE